MKVDRFFDELFSYNSSTKVGSASEDQLENTIIGNYNGIDIVVNSERRSGKPTVAGTRLEPQIISERVFELTLKFMRTLLPDDAFPKETAIWMKNHYREHPHDVPKIIPNNIEEWLSYHQIDDLDASIYENKIINAFRLSVIEIATRRDYTYPRMIYAMCEYYDDDKENIEVLRRHSYDARFCISHLGNNDQPIVSVNKKDDLDGYFVTEDGNQYENYTEFIKNSWDKSWPPDIKYLDHRATFGCDRPPS
jgi:hypothetical protein